MISTRLKTVTCFLAENVSHWLDDFEFYVGAEFNLTLDDISDSTDFYTYLQQFGNDTTYGFAEWQVGIIYDDDEAPTKLEATRFEFLFWAPNEMSDRWETRNVLNDMIEKNIGKDNGFAFEIILPFAFFEYTVTNMTINNILLASAGVFFILCLLMDLRVAVLIICVVVVIDFGVCLAYRLCALACVVCVV